ncbi:hypothetical protein SLS60_010638 [Paraconiothyrium brasiliense]|uniref:Uncharacterized protein n=1 Tax=Paraconiothyrium brasiliense TaxID=300254 RepID=A0ABR3QP28_9PLEO
MSSKGSAPTLPPNVTIFTPRSLQAVQNLLQARLFTRLSASASTTPDQLLKALKSYSRINETFYLSHGNAILIFDGGKEGVELKDAHHDHFRAVCLALKDADISLDVAKCVHDAEDVLQTGFQIDAMSQGSVLVIDLMHAEDEDDDDSDDEEREENEGVGN